MDVNSRPDNEWLGGVCSWRWLDWRWQVQQVIRIQVSVIWCKWWLMIVVTVKAVAASDCCLAVLWGNDFAGSVFARRHLMKLISDRLLRQCNGLMVYNKIERVLVITKQILNYYNTNFSLEIISNVQKVNQKYTFTHKLTTKCNLFFFFLVYLFTGTMHINKHNCKCARISPKGYFPSVDPWQNVKRSP